MNNTRPVTTPPLTALFSALLAAAMFAFLPAPGTAGAQEAATVNDDPFAPAYSLSANFGGAAALYDAPNGDLYQSTYTYPSGATIAYAHTNPTYFGNNLVFPVATGEPGDEWAEVMLSTRPQGETAWVMTGDDYEWRSHSHTIHVFLEERTLLFTSGASGLWEASVAIGRPDRPTPTGKVAIDELIPGPSSAYGPWIVSLGMFSDSIETFAGGLPKIALQGTSTPETVGEAVTSGGIRLRNEDIESLVSEIGIYVAGTPVTIWPSRADFNAAVEAAQPGVSLTMCLGRPVTVDMSVPGQVPTSGDDVILGTPGPDVIAAGDGNDVICAGGGDDIVWGQNGNDIIDGGDGDDRLRGGGGNDVLSGVGGNDDLNGGPGDDTVDGGAGDDAAVRGGTGADTVVGGSGSDALVAGNGGEDTVLGNDGNDKVTGGPRPDAVYGGSGNDEVRGNKGADLLYGGPGDDELFGGPQPDTLDGGDGTDTCNGGTEVDLFAAGTCTSIINP